MAKERSLRIGLYLLAAVLLGAATMQAGFAKERSGAHHARAAGPRATAPTAPGPGPSAAPDRLPPATGDAQSPSGAKPEYRAPGENDSGIKGRASAGEKQDNAGLKEEDRKLEPRGNAAGSEGRGANALERDGGAVKDATRGDSRAWDANPIDTRIIVQPRRPAGGLDKARDLKRTSKIAPVENARRPPAPRASNFVGRNAIGLPVTRHEVVQRPNGERFAVRAPAPSPAATAIGTGGLADVKSGVGGTRPAGPNPNPAAIVLSRGRIDGAAVIRPALAAAGVGGPAKTVAGINGTTFRPKH